MKRIFLCFLSFVFIFNGYEHSTSLSLNQAGFYNGVLASDVLLDSTSTHAKNTACDRVYTGALIHQPCFSSQHTDTSLAHLSVSELTDYFAQAPPADIFCKKHITAILSDAFVAYIKQFPEYEGYIEHFHEKYHKSSAIKKVWRKNVGKRLCELYEELKHEKEKRFIEGKVAALQKYTAQKLTEQHAYLFEQWHQQRATAPDMQKLRITQRMQAYNHRNYAHLSVQQCALSSQASYLLQKHAIDPTKLTSAYGTTIEHQLQNEFIELTEAAVYHMHNQNNEMGQLLIEGIDVGAMALQQKQTTLAAHIADFCWATLDLLQAAGEGVVLAGYNTAVLVHQVVCHPQDTVYGIINGICAVADTLFIINDLPDQLGEHDIPNKEYYYQKIADTEAQLEMLGAIASQRVKDMKPRDWVKHGTAFVVEGVLLQKITNLTIRSCSHIGSLLSDALKSLKYEELVLASIEGDAVSLGKMLPEIEKSTVLLEQAENNVLKSGMTATTDLCLKETNQLLVLLEQLEKNRIHHILQKKHMWHRLCGETVDWYKVKELIKKVITEGIPSSRKGFPTRVLLIDGETVEIVYTYLGDGSLALTNAWVQL